MILTNAELIQLTGHEQHSKQREWLKRNGIGYFVSAGGRPSVTWQMIHNAQTASSQTADDDFNLEGLDNA